MLIVLHASVHLSRGSLLGGVATELLGGLGLDGALGAADGGGAGNSDLEEIGAVVGDLAGDGLVGPIRVRIMSAIRSRAAVGFSAVIVGVY